MQSVYFTLEKLWLYLMLVVQNQSEISPYLCPFPSTLQSYFASLMKYSSYLGILEFSVFCPSLKRNTSFLPHIQILHLASGSSSGHLTELPPLDSICAWIITRRIFLKHNWACHSSTETTVGLGRASFARLASYLHSRIPARCPVGSPSGGSCLPLAGSMPLSTLTTDNFRTSCCLCTLFTLLHQPELFLFICYFNTPIYCNILFSFFFVNFSELHPYYFYNKKCIYIHFHQHLWHLSRDINRSHWTFWYSILAVVCFSSFLLLNQPCLLFCLIWSVSHLPFFPWTGSSFRITTGSSSSSYLQAPFQRAPLLWQTLPD